MTSPDGASPDGSIGVGAFADRQAQTETQAKNEATNGAWKGSWNGAQNNLKAEFISAKLVNGEIVRLDNRIDEIILGTERAFLYTYSESDVWDKHPAAYKVVVDVFSGATGGQRGTSGAGGAGGFGGGWSRKEFTGTALADLPNQVAVTIGAGTSGNSPDEAAESSFGTFVTSYGATTDNYGEGNRTYKLRGGTGGLNGSRGSAGSDGPFASGGSGGGTTAGTSQGGHGFSVNVGQVGPGSAGGGGGTYVSGIFYVGGHGGHGGWPSAPGGGGGAGGGGVGNGGNGAGGAVFVTVYVSDEFGIPPSTPVNLTVSNLTASSVRISWDPAVDDVMVKNYVLFLDGTRYAVVTGQFHDFVGLTPATTYTVQVQAVDLGDNASELSTPLQFTTLV